jgi:hypothetical protein
MHNDSMSSRLRPWIVSTLIVIATVIALRGEGRRWWCQCGTPAIWIGEAWGPHTSQHLFDPYSVSHVTHGLLFLGLAWLVGRRWPFGWQFCLAIGLECLWEVIENSGPVIARFRSATAAVGYEGDTIANSLGDILSAALGVLIARRIGWRWSIALFLAIEVLLVVWIRDNLLLDLVMLIHPIDAVRAWQGHP